SEGRYTYLHSTRAQIFTRSFPRGNIPGPFRNWDDYATFIDSLFATNSISEPTQVWWSLRPHPLFGTLEVRICDSQSNIKDTMAISALLVSLVARLASDYDKGRKLQIINTRELDENIWRALRFGLDGNLVDFKKQREVPVTDVIRELIEFTSVMHEKLGLKKYISSIAEILDDGNGAQKQIRLYEEKNDVGAVFSEVLESNPLI
ncbi:MAG: glutamate-cysteine ligase family protein, partial [Thermoleophilia bacterium]